ncbi:MAG: RHS repeat-associated core domain-containing protein [Gemmatimonadetes bacterium]|nr:RHS repeat-associated core domain-containing protein [Gemmatimonadota bacterium]
MAELDGSGQVVSRFVYGTRVNVPDYMERGGETYRLVTNHLGSVELVVNATTGQVVSWRDYDEWGRVVADSNPDFQPFGFAGGLHDGGTGLVRFGQRDFGPVAGWWTTPDPGGVIEDDVNRYSYVSGDPINLVDPTGRFGIFGAVFGAGLDLALQLALNGINFACVDWGDVALGGVAGALGSGLLAGAGRLSKSTKYARALREYRLAYNIPGRSSPLCQEVHHWFFEANGFIGKHVPEVIKNQPWNFNAIPKGIHDMISLRQFNLLERWLHGTPGWAKGLELSGAGAITAGALEGDNCGC